MPAAAHQIDFALTTLRAVALAATSGEDLPTRLVVVPWGEHSARERGVVRVNQRTLDTFAASQEALRLDRVAIDFEHNTVPGTPAYQASKEPREVAGYGTPVVVLNVGIVLEDIQWTPEGRKALAGGHYQDLSPTAFRSEDGTVLGLHSVALCRHGELEGLTIQAATAAAELLPLFTALSAEVSEPTNTPNTAMNEALKEALMKLLKVLGLEVSEDMEEAKVVELMNGKADELALAATTEEEEGEKEKPAADAMGAELATVRSELDAVRKERLLDQARLEGKVIPLSAEAIKRTPLSVLDELVKKAQPGEVPIKQRGEVPPGVKVGAADAFSAEEEAVIRKFGLTPDQVRENEKRRGGS